MTDAFKTDEQYPQFVEVCSRTGKTLFDELKQQYPFPDAEGGEITFDNNVYEFVEIAPGKHKRKLVSEEPPEPFYLDDSLVYWQKFLLYYIAWQGPQKREDLTEGIALQLDVDPGEIKTDIDQALMLLVDREIVHDCGHWKFYFNSAQTAPEHHGASFRGFRYDPTKIQIIESNEDQVPSPRGWELKNPEAMARYNEYKERVLKGLGGNFRVVKVETPEGISINVVVDNK